METEAKYNHRNHQARNLILIIGAILAGITAIIVGLYMYLVLPG